MTNVLFLGLGYDVGNVLYFGTRWDGSGLALEEERGSQLEKRKNP